jgi:hypothetical protein
MYKYKSNPLYLKGTTLIVRLAVFHPCLFLVYTISDDIRTTSERLWKDTLSRTRSVHERTRRSPDICILIQLSYKFWTAPWTRSSQSEPVHTYGCSRTTNRLRSKQHCGQRTRRFSIGNTKASRDTILRQLLSVQSPQPMFLTFIIMSFSVLLVDGFPEIFSPKLRLHFSSPTTQPIAEFQISPH